MSELVDRLTSGHHPVEVTANTISAFKESIDRGYVHVKFLNTKGGTELGVRLDKGKSDFSAADFEDQRGSAKLVGHLTLDYVKVRCIADVDLNGLKGTGHLEIV